MKTAKILFVLFLVAGAAQAKPKQPGVLVISRNYDIFYFRVNRKQLGGDIRVYNADNKLIAQKRLERKKNIIDFYQAAPGKYTIRIVSKAGQRDFHYAKGTRVSKILVASNAGEEVIATSEKLEEAPQK
ncbi:MAG: hypothetical protein ACOYW3_11175 [Bacteroidota bacterium]